MPPWSQPFVSLSPETPCLLCLHWQAGDLRAPVQLERQLMGDESLEPEVSFALLEMLRVRPESAIVQLLYLEQEMHTTSRARLPACSAVSQQLAVLQHCSDLQCCCSAEEALSAGSLRTCSAPL